jgi:hypothetical protein
MWNTSLGWQEAVVSVGDLGRWIEAFAHLGGWTVRHRGTGDSRLARHWRLADGVGIDEAVLTAPGDEARWLRLMRFKDARQTTMRGGAQAWDTGGIFSLLIRTNDIEGVLASAYELGWNSFNDIDVMSFESHVNRNVVLRAPDGACFGLYQSANAPAGRGTALGMPHTAQMMVKDIGTAKAFFSATLGWSPWFDGETWLAINQFNMPANYAGRVPKSVAIVHARPDVHGQVELVQWRVFAGRDLTARTVPPNRGHLALRWEVDPATAETLRRRQAPANDTTRVTLEPWGEVRLSTLVTPDGAMIELIETP